MQSFYTLWNGLLFQEQVWMYYTRGFSPRFDWMKGFGGVQVYLQLLKNDMI